MCDSIANGGPRFIASSGGSCPPANVTVASNVLATNGNVICANIIAGDGIFSGNLYVAGQVYGNIIYNSINISGTANIGVLQAGVVFGDGYGLSNLQASSVVGTVSKALVANIVADSYQPNIGSLVNLYVANSVTTTNISTQIITSSLFIGNGSAISNLNSSNLVGNVAAANLALVVTQASQPNITSVGTLSSLTVAGILQGNLLSGNGSAISNINSSNLVGNVANTDVALVVSQASQPNITSVGTLTSLTVAGILQGNLLSGNGYAISNINSSNLVGNVASANVAQFVTQSSQPTITSVGILTGLTVAGFTQSTMFFGDGAGISNMNSSNLVGNVANATVSRVVSQSYQPNITSVGTLTGLTVAGIIQGYALRGDGYGITDINASNIAGNVANATVSRVVSQASQPNITSVGTLTGLTVSGITTSGYFFGDGQGITNINPSNISGAVAQSIIATAVSGNSQPNITSVGTLSSLTVSGASSSGLFIGNGSAISNINSSNLIGSVARANLAVAVTGNAQPNVTSLGNLLVLNVISTITAGYFEGDGGHLENLSGANVTGNVARSDLAIYVSSASQPNITSVGTLSSLTVAGILQGNLLSGNGSAISNINSSNLTGTISTSRFPLSGVVSGLYGSSANVSQLAVDTYGRITTATNVAITSSQWTTVASNVAYQNGVSIGTLSSPPTGSNLYVLGTASISNILGTISTPNQPLVTSLGTLDNLTVAGFISANGSAISNINSSNLVGNVAAANLALVVTQASQPNITSVGILSSLAVSGILSGDLFTGNASALSNIPASNLVGAAPYAVVVSGGSQPNITSVGTLSSLSVTGTTVSGYFTGDGRFLSNLTSSSLVGNVAAANLALVVTQADQPNITSTGILSSLNVTGLSNLTALTGSLVTSAQPNITSTGILSSLNVTGISNLTALTGSLITPAQPNITSTGILTSLNVTGLSNLTSLTGSLVTASQPNITSTGILTSLNVTGLSNLTSLTGSLITADQPNITSTGILTSLNVTGISNLTSLTGSLVTPAQPNITSTGILTSLNVTGISNLTSLNVTGISNLTSLTGSLVTASQPNITSVGTLTSLGVTNDVTATRFVGIVNGAVEGSNLISGSAITGSLATSAQPNITSVGTLTSLGVTNAVTATRFVGIVNGAVEGSNLIAGSSITGSLATAAQPNITSTGILTSLNVTGLSNLTYLTGSLVTPAQPNITSVGTLTLLGVTNAVTAARFVGIVNGVVEGSNLIAGSAITGSLATAAQPNITSVGTLTSLGVTNDVTATRFVGIHNGAVEGSNLIAGSSITGSLATASQPNITSTGILTSLNVTGLSNLTYLAGSLVTASQPNITSVGTLTSLGVTNAVTAARFVGIVNGAVEGSNLIAGSSITGSLATAAQPNITSTGILTSLNVTGLSNLTYLTGSLVTASQPNITSVGTLTSLGVTNAVTAARFVGIFNGDVEGSNLISGSSITGSLATASQSNITSVGTLTSLGVTNAVTAARFVGIVNGDVEGSNLIAGSSITGSLATAAQPNITSTGILTSLNVTGLSNLTHLTGSLVTAAQPNITSVGTLTSLGVTNAVTAARFVGIHNGSVEGSNLISGSAITGSLATAAQPNITSVGTLTSLGVTNAVTATRFVGIVNGAVEGSNLIAGSSITGSLETAAQPNITSTGILTSLNVTGISNLTSLTGSLATPSQPNITSTGILTSLNVTGISNLTSLTGSLATPSQPNITSTGILTSLNVTGISNLTSLAGSLITASQPNITSTGILTSLNVTGISNLTSLTGSLITAAQPNITSTGILTSLNVSGLSNLTSLTGSLITAAQPNITSTGILTSLNVTGISNLTALTGSLITASQPNLTSHGILTSLNVSGLSNLTALTGSLITASQPNITSVGTLSTLNVAALSNIGSIVTALANVANLNVSANTITSYLTVTSNILPGAPTGNTYLTGNIIVSGNVFSSTGSPLGAGGGIFLSLGSTYAVPTSYNGGVYGTTYPLTVGLSNNFFTTGTSTFITITSNGNFKFSQAGAYLLKVVFNGSDNVTGLAVGQSTTDTHGTDQNYLYRYTTFVTQNPSELIQIPFNVVNTSNTYYLDLFMVSGATPQLFATSNTLGGTYLTIEPLQGGGVATGGPGGTPPSQWATSGPNIYFSNSVGIGAVNPAYNLDVSTGTIGAQRLVTANISSLGIYGPTLNVNSNVVVTANLAVGGLTAPAPPYALTVYGQGYFANSVSYTNFAGFRNRLTNGTFRVANRANSITVSNTSVFSVSNTWVVDRWRVDVGGLATSNVSFSVKQDVPLGTTNGFTQCANVYVTRDLSGTTGNTWVCPLSQTIESSFIFDFVWGKSSAKSAVFSFTANASVAGDYSVVFRSRTDNTYFANLVSITAGTWQTYTVYLPPCTIGTWASLTTDGYLDVLIGGVSYGVNSSNNRAVAVTSSWTANPGFAPVSCIGATKWPASAGTCLQITAPQLEEGTIATPFEIRPLNMTTMYCQRFYEENPETQYAAALISGRINSVPFVVTKRIDPIVSVYTTLSNLQANTNISTFTSITTAGSYANTAITSYTTSEYGFTYIFTQGVGSNRIDEAQFVWQADAEIY